MSLQVTLNANSAGMVTASVEVLLASDGMGTSGLGVTPLATQNVSISGLITAMAGTLAQASAATPNPVNFGAFRVGAPAPANQSLTISNVAMAPAEGLNAAISTSSAGFNAAGSFMNLAPGATNTMALSVGFTDTATAGHKSGTATITLESDGTFNSGMTTPLPSQTINMSADVFRLAEASVAPNPVNFGNVRLGSMPQQALTISNIATNDGFSEKLNASFSGTSGAATTNGGTITQLNPGAANATNMAVGLDTSMAGARNGTAMLAFASDGTGTSGFASLALPGQNVDVSGTVFRLANPMLNTTSVSLAARVGDPSPMQGVSLTNDSPDQFTEGLKASLSTMAAGFSATGMLDNLAAGNTDATTLKVNLLTSTAGMFMGTATVNLASTGAGTTGAPDRDLGSQDVNLSGKVYTPAVGQVASTTIDFGIVHKGDVVLPRNLSVTNAAQITALNDVLTGSFGGASAPFTASGNLGAGLAAGENSTSLLATLDTSNAGVFMDAATLSLFSHNADLADLSLGDTPIMLLAQVNNFADPAFAKTGGAGMFSGSNLSFLLDFGAVTQGTAVRSTMLAVLNDVMGPADLLDGSFMIHGAMQDFMFSGFDPFMDLAARQSFTGLEIMFDPSRLGMYEDVVILHSFGHNDMFRDALPDVTLRILANVVQQGPQPIPEPGTVVLFASGLLLILGIATRRRTRSR